MHNKDKHINSINKQRGNKKTIVNHRLIGAHMSIAGGVSHAIARGKELGCKTIQIFLRNNNQWQGKLITSNETSLFKKAQNKAGIYPVVGHAIYLVNLASPIRMTVNKSMQALTDDLQRCERLGIPYLVMHAGSHLGAGEETGIKRLATSLTALAKETNKVQILVETTAGQGNQIGSNFQQLEKILNLTKAAVGICFDTCHVFAAGYQLNNAEGFDRMVKEIKKTVGFESIKVIHVNDSKRECGSHIDRHEHIGKGYIGMQGFKLVLNFAPFRKLPFILETPKELNEDGIDMDSINMALIRSCVKI